MRNQVRVAVGAVLLAVALAGCGGGGGTPHASSSSSAGSTPSSTAASSGAAATTAPASSGGATSAPSTVICPTNLADISDVASLSAAAGTPALAIGGTTVYAVTAGSAGTEVSVVNVTGTKSGPTTVRAAGATVAFGAGVTGAVLLSVDAKASGLILSMVDPAGRVRWQVPLPDEDATGATAYGAQVVGDTAYVGTKAGTVQAFLMASGQDAGTPNLPAGLVPQNVLLSGGPYLTMASTSDAGTGAAPTIEVVDPATGDTLGSFSDAFFTDADGDPVAIRNDLVTEVTAGTSITILGNAKGFGSDTVAAAFCNKYVYALDSQATLSLTDLASGTVLTSQALQGLQPDKVTVVAVSTGLIVLGAPTGDDSTVDIRFIPAG